MNIRMERNECFFQGCSLENGNKHLNQTRYKERKSTAYKPGDMNADDIDFEMQFEKDSEELEIFGMNQSGLERFVEKYGQTYRRLYFFHCQNISDFSPLEDLKNLEMVGICWNVRAQRLWNFSKNPSLWSFTCSDSKKLVYHPEEFQNAKGLRCIQLCGPLNFGSYPMRSLDFLADLPALEYLELHYLKLEDHNTSFLDKLPRLQQFNFDPGMFTTEEIAEIVARYPDLEGKYLSAYAENHGEIKVSGYRKPTLSLPKDQKRLEKYIRDFQALVAKYQMEN